VACGAPVRRGEAGAGAGRPVREHLQHERELGHWLEICQLQREDIEFFSALVAESA